MITKAERLKRSRAARKGWITRRKNEASKLRAKKVVSKRRPKTEREKALEIRLAKEKKARTKEKSAKEKAKARLKDKEREIRRLSRKVRKLSKQEKIEAIEARIKNWDKMNIEEKLITIKERGEDIDNYAHALAEESGNNIRELYTLWFSNIAIGI